MSLWDAISGLGGWSILVAVCGIGIVGLIGHFLAEFFDL